MGGAGSAGYTAPTAPAASAAAAPATGQAIATQATPLGVEYLVDGQGRTVYEFANDTNGDVGMHRAVRGQLAAGRRRRPRCPRRCPAVTGTARHRSTRQDGDQPAHRRPATRCTRSPATPHPAETNGQGKTLALHGGLRTVRVPASRGAPVANADPPAAAPAAPSAPSC